ncbi:hypothetical protein AAFC00_002044 [Neodothiora populina]|uniref:Scaffold protein Nfu/NifU N-terminal domain-containing protein n=1 Tax=Neodothiora populina TaxID=2781224 RepID=A0ABR3PG56_9PEZI
MATVPMQYQAVCRSALRAVAPKAARSSSRLATATYGAAAQRSLYHTAPSSITSSRSSRRPNLSHYEQPVALSAVGNARRAIFIQTEDTPNADALKFRPNHPILPPGFSSPFIEYLSPRSTVAPPNPSPLAAQLLSVDGVTSVFYGQDYITISKDSSVPWAHVKPEVFSLITEAVTSGQPIVNASESSGKVTDENGDVTEEQDSLAYNEDDSEVVSMIKELLETRIRPAIQEDGGDIEFRGFVDGQVLLKLRGACRTCDSSTVTLKNGIESMLMHYIDEVVGVQQVMDQEEEVALQEFAKFEEKLRQQKGAAPPSTVGKGSLDTVE